MSGFIKQTFIVLCFGEPLDAKYASPNNHSLASKIASPKNLQFIAKDH